MLNFDKAVGTKIQRQNSKRVLFPSISFCQLRWSDPQFNDGILIGGQDPKGFNKLNISELLHSLKYHNTDDTMYENINQAMF